MRGVDLNLGALVYKHLDERKHFKLISPHDNTFVIDGDLDVVKELL